MNFRDMRIKSETHISGLCSFIYMAYPFLWVLSVNGKWNSTPVFTENENHRGLMWEPRRNPCRNKERTKNWNPRPYFFYFLFPGWVSPFLVILKGRRVSSCSLSHIVIWYNNAGRMWIILLLGIANTITILPSPYVYAIFCMFC